MDMVGRLGWVCWLGWLFGCGPSVETSEGGEAGGGATSGDSGADEGAEGTSVATTVADDGEVDEAVDADATEGPVDGSSSRGDSSDDGSREEVCFFEEVVCNAASCEDPTVINCGFVNASDHTEADWATAQQCVLDAVAAEMPFVAGFSPLPPDGMGTINTGYIGIAGVVYGTAMIAFHDLGYELDSASMRSCATLEEASGCTIDTTADPCLSCIDPGAVGPLCEP